MAADPTTTALQEVVKSINHGLNDEQRLAAETLEGPVALIAGAGSGKTRTLIHRAATLLAHGVPATQLLIVTFTNKAAGEIQERLVEMIGEDGEHIVAGTFHSTIYQHILKRFPESKTLQGLGIDMSQCAILDESDTDSLLREALGELPDEDQMMIEEEEWGLRHFKQCMGLARAFGYDRYEMLRNSVDGLDNEALKQVTSRLWAIYEQKCRAANGIDFDDILVVAMKMLENEPSIAKQLADQWRYVMLDEYQDTSPVQMRIMDAIVAHHEGSKNIFVVGDEKQSIYRFRGADIRVMLDFQKRYKNAKILNLRSNYRSTKWNVRVSNACADAMTQKVSDGQMVAMTDIEGTPPTLMEFMTAEEEAHIICKSIKRNLANGVLGQDMAVLYRSRNLKTCIEHELLEMDIPYQIIGDTSFYQRAEVRDIIALLRFIFRPLDSMAGKRFLGATSIGVDANTASAGLKSGKSVYQYLEEVSRETLKSTNKNAPPKPKKRAKRVQALLKAMEMLRLAADRRMSPGLIKDSVAELFDIFMLEKMKKATLRASKGDESAFDAKLDNISFVLSRFEKGLQEGKAAGQVIDELVMMVEADQRAGNDQRQRVQLMTMHASKGLEWKKVYVMGMHSGVMPGENSDGELVEFNEIEESRRLCYVALTRAREQLVVTWARSYPIHGQREETKASPFIKEIEQRTNLKRKLYKAPLPAALPNYER